jgi:nicotinate-nucleotide adenylyltransferase
MIIVFGGAFNPVTNAHINVATFLLQEFPSARFFFLPVSSAYTKSDLASNHDRVEMLQLAINNHANMSISDLEINDSDFLGTYRSLIRISDNYHEDVAFVIGADNLLSMHKWINVHGILSEFKIIVLGRYNLNIQELIDKDPVLSQHIESFLIYDDFHMDISSTKFRQTMDKNLVPKNVYEYIIKNELYRGENDV